MDRDESIEWQSRVLRPATFVFAFGGLLLVSLTSIFDRQISPQGIIVLTALAVLVIGYVRRVVWRSLAMVLVITLTTIGVVVPSATGLQFSPLLVSALAVTVAAALFGWRAAVSVLATVVVGLLVTGYGVSRGWFAPAQASTASTFSAWVRAAVLFTSVAGALAVVVAGVTRSLEASLRATRGALARLQESEERLALALRGADDGWWDWDVQRNQSWYSPRWWSMLGYLPDELPNDATLWERLTVVEDRARYNEVFEGALASTVDHYEIEFSLWHKDGHKVPVLSRGFVQRDSDGRVVRVSGTNTDLTERRRAQEEREQLERKLQETQKLESLGVLAGGIAHDFNNLLTGVLGNASMAMVEVTRGSRVSTYLGEINEAAQRASELCKQMLAYSGKGRFVVKQIQLGQLVEETTQLLQLSISKKATLEFHLESGLPPVEADATQLRQVIMNLVINASEALGDNSGMITIATGRRRVDREDLRTMHAPAELATGDYVFLEVTDSGVGMSDETQLRIFDPFFTTKFTGRGLGLAAVLGIMRGHRGALKVSSEPGRGSRFTALFPAVVSEIDTIAEHAATHRAWTGHGTVLVVDDEAYVRRTASRMLESMGLETSVADDGREAVDLFLKEPERYSLVLLDLTMPKMDGEQAFTELRRIRPDVRVVLMSGFNQQEAVGRFTGRGLASFVQKPFSIDTLRDAMQRVLG